jgi:hypothetical protein
VKIWLSRFGKGLVPADEAAEKIISKMADGEAAVFEITRPRSVAWLRLYFGLCRLIGHNQDPPRAEDSIDTELRVLAGHYEVMLIEGHEVRVPKRIAFDRLTADEWAELWPSLEQAAAERFGDEYLMEISA